MKVNKMQASNKVLNARHTLVVDRTENISTALLSQFSIKEIHAQLKCEQLNMIFKDNFNDVFISDRFRSHVQNLPFDHSFKWNISEDENQLEFSLLSLGHLDYASNHDVINYLYSKFPKEIIDTYFKAYLDTGAYLHLTCSAGIPLELLNQMQDHTLNSHISLKKQADRFMKQGQYHMARNYYKAAYFFTPANGSFDAIRKSYFKDYIETYKVGKLPSPLSDFKKESDKILSILLDLETQECFGTKLNRVKFSMEQHRLDNGKLYFDSLSKIGFKALFRKFNSINSVDSEFKKIIVMLSEIKLKHPEQNTISMSLISNLKNNLRAAIYVAHLDSFVNANVCQSLYPSNFQPSKRANS